MAPKSDKPKKARAIATASSIYDPSLLALIVKDLEWLGFTDIASAHPHPNMTNVLVFTGKHVDPRIQGLIEKAIRTDKMFRYSDTYGQLIVEVYGYHTASGNGSPYYRSTSDVTEFISGSFGGYEGGGCNGKRLSSYIMKTHNISAKKCRDSYHPTILYTSPDFAAQQKKKVADEVKAKKSTDKYKAHDSLQTVAIYLNDVIEKADNYKKEFGTTMPEIYALSGDHKFTFKNGELIITLSK